MKILFIGDYSNLHACLAGELRRLGHYVTVLSDGGGYQLTEADMLLARRPGLKGSVSYLYSVFNVLPQLRGYDVVQFINPHYLSLKPGKLAYFLKELRRYNGKLYLTLCGNDYYFVNACVNTDIFHFSEFRVGHEPTPFARTSQDREIGYLLDTVKRYTEQFYERLAGAMAVLPEYDMAARPLLGDRCHFTNIPIDLSCHPLCDTNWETTLRVMIGMKPGMEIQKGTAILLEAAREAAHQSANKIEIDIASGLSYSNYLQRMQNAHIVLDQLYAYSPATNALDAMALGKVAATGAQPEYFNYIHTESNNFLISMSPLINDLPAYLSEWFADPQALARMGAEGRKIVERENDVRIVVQKFLNVWNQSL